MVQLTQTLQTLMSSYLSPAPVNNESEAPWILVHTKLKSSHLFSLVTIVNKLTKTQPTLKLLLICSYTIRHVFIYLQNKFLTRFFPHEKARKQENFCLERNNWLIMTSLRVDFSTLCISMSAKYWQEKKSRSRQNGSRWNFNRIFILRFSASLTTIACREKSEKEPLT